MSYLVTQIIQSVSARMHIGICHVIGMAKSKVMLSQRRCIVSFDIVKVNSIYVINDVVEAAPPSKL